LFVAANAAKDNTPSGQVEERISSDICGGGEISWGDRRGVGTLLVCVHPETLPGMPFAVQHQVYLIVVWNFIYTFAWTMLRKKIMPNN